MQNIKNLPCSSDFDILAPMIVSGPEAPTAPCYGRCEHWHYRHTTEHSAVPPQHSVTQDCFSRPFPGPSQDTLLPCYHVTCQILRRVNKNEQENKLILYMTIHQWCSLWSVESWVLLSQSVCQVAGSCSVTNFYGS